MGISGYSAIFTTHAGTQTAEPMLATYVDLNIKLSTLFQVSARGTFGYNTYRAGFIKKNLFAANAQFGLGLLTKLKTLTFIHTLGLAYNFSVMNQEAVPHPITNAVGFFYRLDFETKINEKITTRFAIGSNLFGVYFSTVDNVSVYSLYYSPTVNAGISYAL